MSVTRRGGDATSQLASAVRRMDNLNSKWISAAARAPAPSRREQAGEQGCLATLEYLPPGKERNGSCALTRWCMDAARIGQIFGLRVQVLTNNPEHVRAECPPSVETIDLDPDLSRRVLTEWHARRSTRRQMCNNCFIGQLKWQLVRPSGCKFVLYTDSDVDMTIQEPQAWRRQLPATLRWFLNSSRCSLVAMSDLQSPVNGGTMLIKPSRPHYERALAHLGRHASRSPRGMLPRKYAASPHVQNTEMWQKDTWDFVAGREEQGLLTYVYLMAMRDFCHAFDGPSPGIWARHFWGEVKPWRPRSLYRVHCPFYFRGLSSLTTPCAASLRRCSQEAIQSYPKRLAWKGWECAECCTGTVPRLL